MAAELGNYTARGSNLNGAKLRDAQLTSQTPSTGQDPSGDQAEVKGLDPGFGKVLGVILMAIMQTMGLKPEQFGFKSPEEMMSKMTGGIFGELITGAKGPGPNASAATAASSPPVATSGASGAPAASSAAPLTFTGLVAEHMDRVNPQVVEQLGKAARVSETPAGRLDVVNAMGQIFDAKPALANSSVVAELNQLRSDPDASVRNASSRALSTIADKRADLRSEVEAGSKPHGASLNSLQSSAFGGSTPPAKTPQSQTPVVKVVPPGNPRSLASAAP